VLLLVVIVSLLLVSVLLLLLHQLLLLLLLLDQRYGGRLRCRRLLLRIEIWGRRYRRLHGVVASAARHHQTSAGDVVVGRCRTTSAGLAGRRGGAQVGRIGDSCEKQ